MLSHYRPLSTRYRPLVTASLVLVATVSLAACSKEEEAPPATTEPAVGCVIDTNTGLCAERETEYDGASASVLPPERTEELDSSALAE